MAWASKKQYAILMSSEEGKDLILKLPDMEQETFNDEFAKFLGKNGNKSFKEETNKFSDLENKVKIDTQSLDAYEGQEDMIKRIKLDGKIIGYVEYSVYNNEPHIQMIEISKDYRRKGLATKLLKDLQKDYPKSEVDFGMMTEEGKKLYESSTVTRKNAQYTRFKNKLAKMQQDYEKMNQKWDDFYDGKLKMTDDEIEELNNLWISYNNQIDKISRKLEKMSETKTYIK